MTLVQDPQSAKYQGMPRSAMASGVADLVQSQNDADRCAPMRAVFSGPSRPLPITSTSQTLHKINILLRDRTGNDFSLLQREHESPAHRTADECAPNSDLKQYPVVQADPTELDALFENVINHPFRDPQALMRLYT